MGNDLPEDEWINIHKKMPIICVDCVVIIEGKILLIKRKCEPMKDSWWFPGGRLLKGERLDKAASRIVLKETGIELSSKVTYLGFGETEFKTDPFNHGLGTHTINFVFASTASELSVMKIVLDNDHDTYSTFSFKEVYSGEFDSYVKRFVALSESIIK